MIFTNNMKPLAIVLLALLAAACTGPTVNRPSQRTDKPLLQNLKLPEGFSVSLYADSVPNARSLCLGAKGTLFVGNRKGDKVFALVDTNSDYRADVQYVIASGLHMPNGVAFKDGALYVAEVDKIWRYDDIENRLAAPPKPVLVSDRFPKHEHHGWKYIAFGPDGKLYVPVGAPCNICERLDTMQFASITRMNADGTGAEVYAHGVRNTVGFTWHPATGDLWFTDNGRDLLGDNLPPDELNVAVTKGQHFGYPYCHGGDLTDPEFGSKRPCSDFVKPAQKLQPHGAALGLKFYTGAMFPPQYKGNIFIAEHGSWNSSVPVGYRITRITLEGDKVTSYTPFITGWLHQVNGETKAWGRPVDVLQLADGSLLVSDDFADCIYRVTYQSK
jgi:glucose/arabinose dehydrogenase